MWHFGLGTGRKVLKMKNYFWKRDQLLVRRAVPLYTISFLFHSVPQKRMPFPLGLFWELWLIV